MTHRQYFKFFTTMAGGFHHRFTYRGENSKRAIRGCKESGPYWFSFLRYDPWKVGRQGVF